MRTCRICIVFCTRQISNKILNDNPVCSSCERRYRKSILYAQHPLTQPQLDIGFISLISKLTLDIGVAGFLFNSHIPPHNSHTRHRDGWFYPFCETLATIWGGTPQALVLRLAWTWLDGAACVCVCACVIFHTDTTLEQ